MKQSRESQKVPIAEIEESVKIYLIFRKKKRKMMKTMKNSILKNWKRRKNIPKKRVSAQESQQKHTDNLIKRKTSFQK